MAITSVGYDGTVDEIQFEKIMGYSAHSKYGVNSSGAFAASTVAGQVLQVKIKGNQGTFPAAAWTAGVVDLMDTDETVQLEPATSGSRWDLITLRRDYQPPGGETAFAVVKGTGRKAIPARETNAGVLDDQPLWLVRVDAGKSTPSEYVDLRVWARNGGCTANHDLVRSYMGFTGTQIEINGTLWLRRVGSKGTEEWMKLIDPSVLEDSGWISKAPASGWNGPGSYVRYRRQGIITEFRIRITRTGGSIYVPKNGDIGNQTIFSLPGSHNPRTTGAALASGAVGPLANGYVNANGLVVLSAVAPGTVIQKGTQFILTGMFFNN
ncbi:hypothetical protein [Arthrobacter rhombi]|uniref:hypothetical protein n=1 Tax=Arthrobacter rhombi TaxID=71253 RepID=UPI003FD12650